MANIKYCKSRFSVELWIARNIFSNDIAFPPLSFNYSKKKRVGNTNFNKFFNTKHNTPIFTLLAENFHLTYFSVLTIAVYDQLVLITD